MDEARLLELIENELTGDDAAELQARIAGDPALEAWVARVRRDRDCVAALEDPDLPRDFLAELEPLLARPMLVEPAGELNEFQRRHQRQRRAMRLATVTRRVAMAASVVVVLGGGLWAVSSFMGGGTGGATPVATGPGAPDELIEPSTDGMQVASLAPDATVHHAAPPTGALAGADNTPANSTASPATTHVDVPERGIALVVRSTTPAAVEATLAAAMTPYADRGALVRNFSYDAAVALDRQLRPAPGGTRDGAPAVASTGASTDRSRSEELERLARHIREQRQVNPATPITDSDELLLGERDHMASYEQQLGFSSAGAAYSMAIPADEVDGLLRFLVLDRGMNAQLIVLPEAAGIGEQTVAVAPGQWMQDRAAVAAWLRAHAGDDDTMLQVPVIVVE